MGLYDRDYARENSFSYGSATKSDTQLIAFVILDDSVFGVAVGQAAVFYDKDKLIGGGWIASV